jgi:hypothetical protein
LKVINKEETNFLHPPSQQMSCDGHGLIEMIRNILCISYLLGKCTLVGKCKEKKYK